MRHKSSGDSAARRDADRCGPIGTAGDHAAPIVGEERSVEWSDLRDYVGAFDEPLTDVDLEPDEGRHIETPSIVFDRAQYLAELARADSDRDWEREDRRTARLARVTFRSRADELRRLGYRVRHVSPESEGTPAGVFVMVSSASHHLWLSFPATKAPPEDRAARIVQTVLEDAPEAWPINEAQTTTDT